MVPATPAWSVADMVAHLVGITSDLKRRGRIRLRRCRRWTAAQVHTRDGSARSTNSRRSGTRKHRSSSKACACSATRSAATTWATCSSTRRTSGTQSANHRSTTIRRSSSAWTSTSTRSTRRSTAADVGSVAIQVPDETWVVGSGPLIASLAANRFELFRCLGGRRSERQIRRACMVRHCGGRSRGDQSLRAPAFGHHRDLTRCRPNGRREEGRRILVDRDGRFPPVASQVGARVESPLRLGGMQPASGDRKRFDHEPGVAFRCKPRFRVGTARESRATSDPRAAGVRARALTSPGDGPDPWRRFQGERHGAAIEHTLPGRDGPSQFASFDSTR